MLLKENVNEILLIYVLALYNTHIHVKITFSQNEIKSEGSWKFPLATKALCGFIT